VREERRKAKRQLSARRRGPGGLFAVMVLEGRPRIQPAPQPAQTAKHTANPGWCAAPAQPPPAPKTPSDRARTVVGHMDPLLQADVRQVEAADDVGADGLDLETRFVIGGWMGGAWGVMVGWGRAPGEVGCGTSMHGACCCELAQRACACCCAVDRRSRQPGPPAHLVGLTPVHVGAPRHAGRIQHMRGLDLFLGGERHARRGVGPHARPSRLLQHAAHACIGMRAAACAATASFSTRLTRSSSARMVERSSRRAFAYSNLAPCFFSRSPTRPPIQPLLPKMRKTCVVAGHGREGGRRA